MSKVAKPDTLALCVNANFVAEALEEKAEMKHASVSNRAYCEAGYDAWAQRLARWAMDDKRTAKHIRALVAEIERLGRSRP